MKSDGFASRKQLIPKLFSLSETDIRNDIFIGGVNAGPKDCQISDLASPQSTLNLTPLGWRNDHLHKLFKARCQTCFVQSCQARQQN